MTEKTYHIAWNEAKTVGVICEDPQLAYELRKGAQNPLGIVSGAFMDAWGDMTADDAGTVQTVANLNTWQPIEAAPKNEHLLLYFPAQEGRNALPEMIKVDQYPVHYPRQPTHFMRLANPPTT